MTKTTTTPTMTTAELLAQHRVWVETYNDVVYQACSRYPELLNDREKEAYLLLPSLIDYCRQAYSFIPEDAPGRPVHYLSHV